MELVGLLPYKMRLCTAPEMIPTPKCDQHIDPEMIPTSEMIPG